MKNTKHSTSQKNKAAKKLTKKTSKPNWPQKITDLKGAWSDFPSLKEIRDIKTSDIKREKL